MTPGKRRRLDRRYSRNEGWKEVKAAAREGRVDFEALRNTPHPKRSTGTAYDYVSWLIENGHNGHAYRYLNLV